MLLSKQEIFQPNLLKSMNQRVWKNIGKGLSLVKTWEKGYLWKKQGPQGCLKITWYKRLSLKKREKGCLSKKQGKRVVSKKSSKRLSLQKQGTNVCLSKQQGS